jgi:hypothetical protein
MSAFTEHKDELEHYEQMFGKERGRLAVGLDRLTNALVLVGTARGVLHEPEESNATGDGHTSDRAGVDARERLVQSVMAELKKAREEKRGGEGRKKGGRKRQRDKSKKRDSSLRRPRSE